MVGNTRHFWLVACSKYTRKKADPMYDDIPLMLTVEEAGKLLHIGRNRMYDMVHDGRILHIKNGKRILIPRNAVVDFLTSYSKD